MSEHLESQCAVLVRGVNAFEPILNQLHQDFLAGNFADWPTVILATTIQATAVSIFKLLPPRSDSSEILDQRSIATLVRNVVDTHDVIRMMIDTSSPEESSLHRCILGMYLSGRINKVRKAVDPAKRGDFYSHAKSWYWEKIQASPLYSNAMLQLKDGEQFFYTSRKSRVLAACGEDTEFVLGILADLSTFVHSVPPSLWMGSIEQLYYNTKENRDIVAVWIRLANFYIARCIQVILKTIGHSKSEELEWFMRHHKSVFN